jgi:hypothetical protein
MAALVAHVGDIGKRGASACNQPAVSPSKMPHVYPKVGQMRCGQLSPMIAEQCGIMSARGDYHDLAPDLQQVLNQDLFRKLVLYCTIHMQPSDNRHAHAYALHESTTTFTAQCMSKKAAT